MNSKPAMVSNPSNPFETPLVNDKADEEDLEMDKFLLNPDFNPAKAMIPDPKFVKPDSDNKTIEMTEHTHNYVPLWAPLLAFVLIVIAYLYCMASGIAVNEIRAYGVIGISAVFAALYFYLNK